MKVEQFAGKQPTLSLEEYFLGTTQAWGIFEDRFGQLRRSFQVTIEGRLEGDKLVLEEDFLYDDGTTERRVWTLTPLADNRYRGHADGVVGEAAGRVVGNAFHWRYKIDMAVGDAIWRVHFDDWMFLQPGGVLINRASVSKWGVQLGEVTLFFSKQPAETPEAPPLAAVAG